MSSTRLRVAVVGCGIGREHLRAYRQLAGQFELVGLCDIDGVKATAVATEFAIPHTFISFDQLCQWDGVDVIDICTPSYQHVTQSVQALAAGKHVICEKPQAGSLAEIDQLIQAEQAASRWLMPIFNYRFGHGLQKLRHLQALGLTGQTYLSTIEVAWQRGAAYYAVPWRGKWHTELGGCLVTHAIHAHDALFYLLGPAKSVFARLKTMVNPIETEDSAVLSLEMADGSLASSAVTLGSLREITRQRYCFANLTVESNLAPYAENTAEPWRFDAASPEIEGQLAAAWRSFVPQSEGYAGQFGRFYTAVQTQTPPPVTLLDARRSIELVTAVYHSARTNQPVTLPLRSDHPLYGGWRVEDS